MFVIFPKKYELDTRLTPKKVMRRIEGDLQEYKPTINILSTARFMKMHRQESVYYGRHDADSFEVYFHRMKRRDGGSTGFYGRVSKTESGAHIKGWFRKPVYAYVIAVLWVLICLFCAVGTYAAGSQKGAYIFLGIGAAGFLLMLCDGNEKYIMAYLDEFPEPEIRDRGVEEIRDAEVTDCGDDTK